MMRALTGKRIVNTRAVHQAATLDVLLREHGAEPLSYPCIAIVPPENPAPLDNALRAAASGAFAWIVLTSTNTVLALAQRLETMGLSLQSVPNLSIAAVGASTAQAAKKCLGLNVDLIPDEFTAESLATALADVHGMHIFLPESAIARPALADTLRTSGAMVTVVEAYRTIRGSGGVDIPALLARRQVDAIVFTSSSTTSNFLVRLATEGGNRDDLQGVCIACIGPQAAQTARECGLVVSVIPGTHTLEGLVVSLESYFENVRTGAQ